jgi:Family of unknown function (DUF5362)
MEQQTDNLLDLQIDMQSNSYLTEAAKWSKFLAIIGFISCGLMLIIGIATASIFSGNASSGVFAGMGGLVMSSFYFVFAIVYFFPCLYLLRFASKMQVALRRNDQQELNNSFANLKSCFRFMGILTIVVIALYIVGIFFVVLYRSSLV